MMFWRSEKQNGIGYRQEDGIDTLVYEEKVLGAEDTMYKVKREDIGFKLKCVVRQGKTPALQKKNGVINIVTKQYCPTCACQLLPALQYKLGCDHMYTL